MMGLGDASLLGVASGDSWYLQEKPRDSWLHFQWKELLTFVGQEVCHYEPWLEVLAQ